MNNTEDEKNIFSKNLQLLINQKNWTIQKAAKELGYDRNDLSKILVGNKNFELRTVVHFAQFFNVSVFLLFDRLFENEQYRTNFPFVEADYISVIRNNFRSCSAKQSHVDMDPSTVSQIMNGGRNNPTIDTLHKIADGASVAFHQLLKTEQDKQTENKLKEDEE